MRVKFKGQKYHVSPCDKIYISSEKLVLWLKRWNRRFRLLFRKEDVSLYLLIALCWAFFGATIYAAGQFHIATKDNPYTIGDVLWDIKGSCFTSIVLAFVIGAFTRIREYMRKIQAQHSIYVTAMTDFERVVEPYLGQDLHCFYPFYNEKCLEDTIAYMQSRFPAQMSTNSMWKSNLALVINRLNRVEQEIIKNNIIIYSVQHEDVLEELDKARYLANQMLLHNYIQRDDVVELSSTLKYVIDRLREPWRVDLRRNIRILERLSRYSENEIEEDFYYKMFLTGHQFNNGNRVTAVKVRRKH